MKSRLSNLLYCILLLSLLFHPKASDAQQSSSAQIQYKDVFGESFSQALNYLSEHKWMKDTLLKRGIEPEFALAIVFPELVRYSKLFDLIEVSALKTLYLQFGKTYSNFSIGRFQMKPSFAESVERDWNLVYPKPKSLMYFSFDTLDNLYNRQARLQRIDNIQGQLLYLSMFIYVVKFRHPINFKNNEERVLFYATAYNYSYRVSSTTVISNIFKKRFHTDLFETPLTNFYSYADIALFFYKNQLN